jgi:hypothetical protein
MLQATPDQDSITSDREETKFLVAAHDRKTLVAALNEHLPSHRHSGEGANRLPGPEHFVTTVYFDTPTRRHFRAALGDTQQNVKVRVKEYYDVHPSLAELATDASQVLHQSAHVWLELKRRAGDRTTKQRVRLERRSVPTWLREQGAAAAPHDSDAAAIRAYCQSLAEPLVPSCLVNYRRASWQAADDALRVTLDAELAFFEAPNELWSRPSLSRAGLGTPRLRESRLLLEVKQRGGPLPAWLVQTLLEARARPVSYSKFLRAAESVHDDG